ncbi:FHIPEP family type III secretion protein [Paraburkholderia sp. Tr-20389]|uniref:flagellar biosynthesis protein FlhA n=1 Tax=Paraburkholderia sp. Tr-20389 TaxID=2703903 RepID=UPI001981331C|nr:flagellar biosynthesis protein FlhA [Paraburkholderia sp. Tr-20389]MBN3754985.1 FHIPEP family type III secretion protein [Paraburkholderia sp. Tr-20389]
MKNIPKLRRIDLLGVALRHADLSVGVGMLGVLLLLILPVPPFVLDLSIGVSFTVSFVMLTATLYAAKAVELSSFPSLLLMTTLLRLALAIASTKMILLHAHAGQIIGAFGEMVVGGNVAVGIVVFIVLSAIQFIVVAKGADRVAEVSARFTLDGIPGRQMSIDADLRGGLISGTEAGQLRRELERETYFYGSLDGAMKFVKGDAIAGLVVALVNIVGGLAVGIGQRGMSFGDALHTYTILTVGDGLVSQIPSLIVSISAGLLVTRVSSGSDSRNLGGDILTQLSLHPPALAMAGVACVALAAIPGFPHVQFLLVASMLIGAAVAMIRQRAAAQRSARPRMPAMTRDGGNYVQRILDDVELGTSTLLRVRLGRAASQALDGVELNDQLAALRRDLIVRLGVPFPGLVLLKDERLDEHRYIVDIEDVPYSGGTLVPDHVLVSGEAALVTMEGTPGYHPSAEKSIWVSREAAAAIDDPQFIKSSPNELLCAHLTVVCEERASSFVGTQETKFLLNLISVEFRELVALVQKSVTTVQLAFVLRSLLEQRVSIRNMRAILEAVLRVPDGERSLDRMVRDARIALASQLVRSYADLNTWQVDATVLDPAWEADLEAQIEYGHDGEPRCVLNADSLESIKRSFTEQQDATRVIVTTAVLRPHLERILRMLGIRSDVLAIDEIPSDSYRVRVVARLAPG